MARPDRSPPLFVALLGASALATLVPSFYGAAVGDFDSARVFFYSGILFAVAALLLGLAVAPTQRAPSEQRYLLSLVLGYLWLPAILSLPMMQLDAGLRLTDVYFDMVSALTTTGAEVFAPASLPDTVHLWRATVAWFGGMLIWITALAILAPLNLGGFELTAEAAAAAKEASRRGQIGAISAAGRLRKQAGLLGPIYLALTVVLALGLTLAGERPLHAVIHAMSTLSTSGISAVGGPSGGAAGFAGEVLILLFFVFALTHASFAGGFGRRWGGVIVQDRQVRLAVLIVVVLSSALFLRHWLGAYARGDLGNPAEAFATLWGSIFTVLSFLTTTGFVAEGWMAARGWSGLPMPGLVLVGLVVLGGGIATTAGGLKLLRIYALYKHGAREIDRLVHPHSVAGAGRLGRRIRQEGAYKAWIFAMLLLVTIGGVSLMLGAAGVGFEQSLILAIAAISTTGPLAEMATEAPIAYSALGDAAKMILALAMIIGRIETLVFVAVFNPSFWRA